MIELLTQIVHFIWDLLPRPVIVGPTEAAVCYWLGRWGKVKPPGFYVIWPLIQYWRTHVVVSQVCETAIIAVSSADSKDWQWRLGIEYEIHDVLKYETMQFNGQNHLEMLGGSALVKVVSNLTSQQIHDHGVFKICSVIKKRIYDTAELRGITVLGVRPIMASQCRPLFLSNAERLVD